MQKIVLFYSVAFFSCLFSMAQVVNPANKKFNVYKIDVNPNATKEGIRGIAVLFSCEFLISDAEYNGMKDKQGKVRMTFYAGIRDASNEPVYQAYDFPGYKKSSNYVGVHFADEIVLMPQNKAQGLRNTGIELFIPFTSTALPEGANNVTFALNAYNEKAGRFENIHTQKVAITKPATYAVTLQPQQIAVIDKAGKRYEVGQLEQDIFALPGSKKEAKDITAFANVDLKDELQFTYCEGDVIRLKLQKSIETGLIRLNKTRVLRTKDGKPLPSFDNVAGITGEWTFDTKAVKTTSLKNNGVEIVLRIEKYKIPAVQLSAFKVNPFSTHEGVTGTSITFDYKATVGSSLPPLTAWLTYQPRNTEEIVNIHNGKVISGQAKLDSTGLLTLSKSATSGKMEVFYPAYQILLQDPNVRQQPSKQFSLQIHLANNPYVIARKEAKTDLTIQTVREAVLPTLLKLKDTLVAGVNGVTLSLPYTLPKIYFDTKEQKSLEIMDGGKENKVTELFRKITVLNEDVKRINPTSKTAVTYQISKPQSAVKVFLPYTSLNKVEEKPLPFRVSLNITDGTNKVTAGESIASIQYQIDRSKLRFVSVGIANIKLKEANTGDIAWRIRSKDKILYESKLIPADKLIENLYTDAFYIHEDDKLVVEMLKGKNAETLKVAVSWEKPVKNLTSGEQITLEPSKLPNNTDDGDTKSLTITYTAQ
ncbi:hypothetical protein QNI19_10710 [Cytophagaceae bacterium DM2B3-1]|uniref:Uncharacterized protein n=1 Tax=Xanthocytophaga flava TaxID=3048013 RepID=A0ABT7CK52_9BACT|nr:hypothetical protein [Xanthocytophaga flavus]MDJ1493402.1 hypothetical protein [Xanthocytophaga flavus]